MKFKLILVVVIASIVFATNYNSLFSIYAVDNSKPPVYQCIKSSDPNDNAPNETCCRGQKEKSEDGSGKTVTGIYCITCPKDGSPCKGPEIKLGELDRFVKANNDVSGMGGNLNQKGVDNTNGGKDMSTANQDTLAIDRNILAKDNEEGNDKSTKNQDLTAANTNSGTDAKAGNANINNVAPYTGDPSTWNCKFDESSGKKICSCLGGTDCLHCSVYSHGGECIPKFDATATTKLDDSSGKSSGDPNSVKGNTIFDSGIGVNKDTMKNTADNTDDNSADNSQNKATKDTGVYSGLLDKVKSDAAPTTGGVSEFKCDKSECTCKGDTDCNNMFSSGACYGGILDAGCDENGCWCTAAKN